MGSARRMIGPMVIVSAASSEGNPRSWRGSEDCVPYWRIRQLPFFFHATKTPEAICIGSQAKLGSLVLSLRRRYASHLSSAPGPVTLGRFIKVSNEVLLKGCLVFQLTQTCNRAGRLTTLAFCESSEAAFDF